MGLFDQFPYTNFHELNLDWMLQALKELEHTIDQFVAINALKYADPIQWNITSQYEKNTIVIDPQTGTAYISVQPVPTGVLITNTDYWSVVFDLGSFVVRAAKNFTNKWESETTLTATFPSAVNDWLIWGDTLYLVISPIVAGDQYVVGSNIVHFTAEDVIGHIQDLNTTDKTNLVAAINEIISNIGDLNNLATTDKSSVVNAINEIYNFTVNLVGDLNNLITTDKTDIVSAINDTYNEMLLNRNRIATLEADNFVTPEQFGAKGDGINDDTQAIIDALAASDYVYFHGTYHTTSSIQVVDNKHLIALGGFSGAYFIDQFATGTFDITGAFNVFFKGLTFLTHTGSHEANSFCIYANSTAVNPLTGLNVEDCWCIEGNNFNDNVKFIRLQGFFNIIHIKECLLDCGVSDSGAPIELVQDAAQTLIQDVNIYNCFFDALNSSGSNLYLENIREAEIIDCTFRVETTPYNLTLASSGIICTANVDHSTFISAKNNTSYGKIKVSTGAIFNDRGCIRWLCIFENDSIYNYEHNGQLTGLYSPSLGVLVNGATTSANQDGGYSITLPKNGANKTNYGVGFLWNTATRYYFKLDSISNDSDIEAGCGFISNIYSVSRLVVKAVETTATSAISPATIDTGDLPVTPTITTTVSSRECYQLKEMDWNNVNPEVVIATKYMHHLEDAVIRIDVDPNTLLADIYISSDLNNWYPLFTGINAAGYDVIGIAGYNMSSDDAYITVNGIWH